jgi:hypothetical protein
MNTTKLTERAVHSHDLIFEEPATLTFQRYAWLSIRHQVDLVAPLMKRCSIH